MISKQVAFWAKLIIVIAFSRTYESVPFMCKRTSTTNFDVFSQLIFVKLDL